MESCMEDVPTPEFLRKHITRDQLLDLVDSLRVARRRGGEGANVAGLSGSSGLSSAWFTAHQVAQQPLRNVVPKHGATLVERIIPGTDIRVYQVMGEYGGSVVIAHASISPGSDFPRTNCSRRNAVHLNRLFDSQGSLALASSDTKVCRCF